MQRVLLPVLACAAVALVMPVLFMLVEAAVQGDTIGLDDLQFGYVIVAPFACLVSLVVVWPVWVRQSQARSFRDRLAVAALASILLPMAALLPLAGELPWKAGVAGLGTLLIWLATYYIGQTALIRSHHIRSNPSG